MDIRLLELFIKQAALSPNPEMQQMAGTLSAQVNPQQYNTTDQTQSQDMDRDPDAETVDEDIVEVDKNKDSTDNNIEGKLLEGAFDELEKDPQQQDNIQASSEVGGIKSASLWDKLVLQHR